MDAPTLALALSITPEHLECRSKTSHVAEVEEENVLAVTDLRSVVTINSQVIDNSAQTLGGG